MQENILQIQPDISIEIQNIYLYLYSLKYSEKYDNKYL